jgi:multidrug efflux pump subunit AcrB
MNLNPIIFALRHPITVMVAMAGIVVGSVLAVTRMNADIFPVMNLPVLYVAQPYGGMDPAQMEGLLTTYYEYHFFYLAGIHHVESKNIQGVAVMKLFFYPGTDMGQALADTMQNIARARAYMPVGTVSPAVIRLDTGSLPVGYLVLTSDTRNISEVQDLAHFTVRPRFASLPGVSAPPPFGGNSRTIVLRVDPHALRKYNASPDEVIAALCSGNVISPSGAIYVKDQMPIVPTDALVVKPPDLGKIPLRLGSNVYLRDLCVIEDASDIPFGFALVNGKRSIYLLASKRAEASTLAVVNGIKGKLREMQDALPEDVHLAFEFDQSPYLTASMRNVVSEGLLGALFTGLMVLIFLRDWRTLIVVILNIPLSLLGSVIGLWLTGQTINLMTLGGLALSVGILVDEATVAVENIHVQMESTPRIARAVLLGTTETAVPRLLAMLCILAVFVPSFFMQGAAQSLFVPLSLAVGFAVVTSYILSSTFVPVLSVWLLKHHREKQGHGMGLLGRSYASLVGFLLRLRWPLVGAYAAITLATLVVAGPFVGTEIFPVVDAGQFQLRLRAATGTNITRTEQLTIKALEIIGNKVGPDNVTISAGYCGLIPPPYPLNSIFQFMSGPEESVIRIAFKKDSGIDVERLKSELRQEMPEQLAAWLRDKMRAEGFPTELIDQRVHGLRLSFEPSDTVNQVMSFGADTPIEVAVSGPNYRDNRRFAARVKLELEKIPSLVDVQYVQALDYPTIDVRVDREKSNFSRVTAEDAARALVAATSSSRFIVPNFWRDSKSGIGYMVQVQVPITEMKSATDVGLVPVQNKGSSQSSDPNRIPLLLRDVADIQEGTMPGEYDRFNMTRVTSIMANIEGEDLGRVARQVKEAIQAAGDPPRGVVVDIRGQIEPMEQMFSGLSLGLGLAILTIFLLLTGYFQSVRLALVVMATSPAVMAGVVAALLVTGTTLNIQSFMGAIMAIGVATANSILLVTFAERARREGQPALEAALDGTRHRLRPILMTSCAMIAGMLPMALALGEGGQQVAPLGRAVIGGLLAATLTTLLVLPAIFAVVQRRSSILSVSLDPTDPKSSHFDGA